jgi:uncharacterized protein (UPF0276 family)
MTQTATGITDIPFLGVGLGYRRELKEGIFAFKEEIDFLEIITEQYIYNVNGREQLEKICEEFQVIPHGVSLSIGSMSPLDKDYLRAVKQISDLTKSPYYSEHLCMTSAPGIEIGHLSPLWFTEKTLQNAIRNVSEVQEYLGKPLILENVTYLFEIPASPMSQTTFFQRLVGATGCGVLLDATNVFINALNHHFDPIAFLDEMPLDHVVQVHLAGGYWKHGTFVDGHSEPVQEESWDVFKALVARCQVRGVIFEHDDNFPEMTLLVEQIRRAKKILQREAEVPA